jgi:glycosyltransferase involved in cell wall biosynthesis
MTRAAILNAFDPETYKGGIETFILTLRDFLVERNFQVDIHCMSPSPTLKIDPFPIRPLIHKVPEFLLNCFMMGRAFSKIEKEYDLVISNNFYGLGYFAPKVKGFTIYHSTHAAYADALRSRLPEKDYRNLKYGYGYLGDWLSGRGKMKIAVSKTVRNELVRYYHFRKVDVVNHGIDTAFFRKMEGTSFLRKKWGIPPDSFVGIFVGRWEIGKGTDIMEEIITRDPGIVWIFVTGPSDCPLTESATLRVVRNTARGEMRELYSLSDFLLLPSYYEGFGLAIIEAMACELPVICTEVGVAKDLLEFDALRRFILPSLDKKEMVKEISHRIALLRNGTESKELVTIGRSIVEGNYHLDIWKRRMAAALGLPL